MKRVGNAALRMLCKSRLRADDHLSRTQHDADDVSTNLRLCNMESLFTPNLVAKDEARPFFGVLEFSRFGHVTSRVPFGQYGFSIEFAMSFFSQKLNRVVQREEDAWSTKTTGRPVLAFAAGHVLSALVNFFVKVSLAKDKHDHWTFIIDFTSLRNLPFPVEPPNPNWTEFIRFASDKETGEGQVCFFGAACSPMGLVRSQGGMNEQGTRMQTAFATMAMLYAMLNTGKQLEYSSLQISEVCEEETAYDEVRKRNNRAKTFRKKQVIVSRPTKAQHDRARRDLDGVIAFTPTRQSMRRNSNGEFPKRRGSGSGSGADADESKTAPARRNQVEGELSGLGGSGPSTGQTGGAQGGSAAGAGRTSQDGNPGGGNPGRTVVVPTSPPGTIVV